MQHIIETEREGEGGLLFSVHSGQNTFKSIQYKVRFGQIKVYLGVFFPYFDALFKQHNISLHTACTEYFLYNARKIKMPNKSLTQHITT